MRRLKVQMDSTNVMKATANLIGWNKTALQAFIASYLCILYSLSTVPYQGPDIKGFLNQLDGNLCKCVGGYKTECYGEFEIVNKFSTE